MIKAGRVCCKQATWTFGAQRYFFNVLVDYGIVKVQRVFRSNVVVEFGVHTHTHTHTHTQLLIYSLLTEEKSEIP